VTIPTNREIADSPGFPVTLALAMCPNCNFVGRTTELEMPRVPCPKCNKPASSPEIFPGISGLKLLEMIGYFYRRAAERIDDTRDRLVKALEERAGRRYASDLVTNAVSEVRAVYKEGTSAEFNEMLDIIEKRFSLTRPEASKVYPDVVGYSESHEEHMAVVILTSTLLETLLHDLLVFIHVARGKTWPCARQRVKKLRGFGQATEDFHKSTGTDFETAVQGISGVDFLAEWNDVRRLRNDFIHGKPFVLGIRVAEKAFDLALRSPTFFALLQNNHATPS
jgi:hypothetical protein